MTSDNDRADNDRADSERAAGSQGAASDTISTAGRVFLVAWVIALVLLVLAVLWATAFPLRQSKLASVQRHRARMDPKSDDPGLTPPVFTLPDNADPARVRVGMYVDRVVELSVKDASWTVDFYVWFRWCGDSIETFDGFQVIDGWIESQEREVALETGGEHYERYRVIAKISKTFDISRFPRDDHLLTINIEHPQRQRHDVFFVADEQSFGVSSRVRVPAYEIYESKIVEKPHSYKSTRGDPRLVPGVKSTYSQCRLGIGIRRPDWGFYFKLFQSLHVAVAIALLAMFVKPTNVDPRFGLGVGGLFAAVANSYVTASLIPDTGVMTLADTINGIGVGMILVTVIQSTVSLYLFERLGAETLSRRFDQLSFGVLAAGYLALNLALPLAAS